jgi:hypothetical protein
VQTTIEIGVNPNDGFNKLLLSREFQIKIEILERDFWQERIKTTNNDNRIQFLTYSPQNSTIRSTAWITFFDAL